MLEGKKTVIFFVLTLVIALAQIFGFADYQPTGDEAALIGVFVSIAGIALRKFTKTPIFKKS